MLTRGVGMCDGSIKGAVGDRWEKTQRAHSDTGRGGTSHSGIGHRERLLPLMTHSELWMEGLESAS